MHPSIAKYSPIALLYHYIENSDLALYRIRKNSSLFSKQPDIDDFISYSLREDSFLSEFHNISNSLYSCHTIIEADCG